MSKQLLEKQERTKAHYRARSFVFTVSHLESKCINEINIVNASIKAIQRMSKLEPQPENIICCTHFSDRNLNDLR
jgi:ribonuclease HII